jgi:hypothetical protein
MTLLIPCSESFQTSLPENSGSISGELPVDVAKFKQAVTMFCLAHPEEEESWLNSEFLHKVKQYNIWNKRVYRTGANRRDRKPVHLWSEHQLHYQATFQLPCYAANMAYLPSALYLEADTTSAFEFAFTPCRPSLCNHPATYPR